VTSILAKSKSTWKNREKREKIGQLTKGKKKLPRKQKKTPSLRFVCSTTKLRRFPTTLWNPLVFSEVEVNILTLVVSRVELFLRTL
jgi:hypothetical protein